MPFFEAAVYSDRGSGDGGDNFCFKGQFLDAKATAQDVRFAHVHHDSAAFYGVFEGTSQGGEGVEKAAFMSAQAFVKAMPSARTNDRPLDDGNVKALITSAAIRANDSVQSLDGARANKLGAHYAGICFYQDKAQVSGLGDCRAYLLRDNEMKVVTKDSRGYLGAFGFETPLQPEFEPVDLRESDTFLICSSGLWGVLTESQMRDILSLSYSMREIAAMLIDQAISKGSDAPSTAIVVKVKSMGAEEGAAPRTRAPLTTQPAPAPATVINNPITAAAAEPILPEPKKPEPNKPEASQPGAQPSAQPEAQPRQRLRASSEVTPTNLASTPYATPRERPGTPPPVRPGTGSGNGSYRDQDRDGGGRSSRRGVMAAWLFVIAIIIIALALILPNLQNFMSGLSQRTESPFTATPIPTNNAQTVPDPTDRTAPEPTQNVTEEIAPEPTQDEPTPEPTQEPEQETAPEPENEAEIIPPITENEPIEYDDEVTPEELELAPEP